MSMSTSTANKYTINFYSNDDKVHSIQYGHGINERFMLDRRAREEIALLYNVPDNTTELTRFEVIWNETQDVLYSQPVSRRYLQNPPLQEKYYYIVTMERDGQVVGQVRIEQHWRPMSKGVMINKALNSLTGDTTRFTVRDSYNYLVMVRDV